MWDREAATGWGTSFTRYIRLEAATAFINNCCCDWTDKSQTVWAVQNLILLVSNLDTFRSGLFAIFGTDMWQNKHAVFLEFEYCHWWRLNWYLTAHLQAREFHFSAKKKTQSILWNACGVAAWPLQDPWWALGNGCQRILGWKSRIDPHSDLVVPVAH